MNKNYRAYKVVFLFNFHHSNTKYINKLEGTLTQIFLSIELACYQII